MNKIKYYWENYPFALIIIAAAIMRLIAAVFAKGYAMSDDHFVVIHVAQRWVDGYNNWFNSDQASHFSLVYPGFHYLLFSLLEQIGITDPQVKMFFVRLLHAVYSLLIVIYGYLITLELSDEKTARQTGIILALFWVLPFMSVRNLAEIVCIPPMLIGYYLILIAEEKNKVKFWVFAGLAFGLAFALRYQTLILTGGIGLVFIFQQKWKSFFYFASGVTLGMFCLQGLVDWFAWGYPFASFFRYFFYNLENRFNYVIGPWYRYVLLILAVLIPPVSIFIILGAGRMWKRIAIISFPLLIFLIFHSLFPNKQERFILPILPLILITGIIGWNDYSRISGFWQQHKKLLKGIWIWFWIINSVLLILVTFNYPKKSLVEPLNYLSTKDDIKGLIIEYNRENMPWFPRFYLTKNVPVFRYTVDDLDENFKKQIITGAKEFPNYILFFGNEELEKRIIRIENVFHVQLEFDHRINPSFLDNILHTLNPRRNLNLTSNIYKIENRY